MVSIESENLAYMKHLTLILFLTLIGSFTLNAANQFTFSPKLKKAYEAAISIRFDEATTLLAEVKSEEPNNMMAYYVENYVDILKVYINEDYEEFKRLEPNKDKRLKKLKTGDENSPYYLYTQAEIRLQWAVARAKFDEYSKAMFEVRRAFIMLEKNEKIFPDFVANKKSLGILHSIVGAVPPNYKFLVKMGGLSGTIEQGRGEIKEVLRYADNNPSFIFKNETIIMYAFTILHIGNEGKGAWNIINSSSLDASKNPLICFAQASIAQHTGNNDKAIQILENRPKGKAYHDFHYLDYMLGLSKLYKQDDDAGYYLNKYVMNFKGRNYIKECYHRIAWFELLKGNEQGFKKNMTRIISRGHASIEGDKSALKAAESGKTPNTTLLKARLLFDGGYYKKAQSVLESKTAASFSDKAEQLEFLYRKGRIYQALKKHDQAISSYNTTIEKGSQLGYYFACRAALEAGTINEELAKYDAARTYYNKCLDLSPDEYKNGLHAKAKAGLNRIKKK